jgi:hypothetical protein
MAAPAVPAVVGVMDETEEKLTALSTNYMKMDLAAGTAAIKELRRLVAQGVESEQLSERAAMIRADQIDTLFARIKARSPAGQLEDYDQIDIWWRSAEHKAWLAQYVRARDAKDRDDDRRDQMKMCANFYPRSKK